MSAKLEEGDFKGAVRLASSEDTLAPCSEVTFELLKERHPDSHPDSTIPPIDENSENCTILVTEEEVAKVIRSFPKSSTGGSGWPKTPTP